MGLTNTLRLLRAMTGSGGIESFRDAAEQEVMQLAELVPAGEHSVRRFNTAPPDGGVNKMIRKMPLRKKIRMVPVFLRIMNTVTRCAEYMSDELTPTKGTGDNELLDTLKEIATGNGSASVGFVRIAPDEIFKDYAIPYQNAIVFTMEMDKAAIDTAPSYDALIEVLTTYATLGKVAIALTEHLRSKGYGAYPGFPVGGMVDYVRIAEQAGLGAIGYHGMLITPQDGTRLRINVVYTNLEISEPAPNAHLWVRDFCAMCNKCVRDCPPNAIYTEGEVNPVTGRKATLHYDKCIDYFGSNNGCAICVKICPFSQAGYDVIQTRFKGTNTMPS